jgi:hypothetical protein
MAMTIETLADAIRAQLRSAGRDAPARCCEPVQHALADPEFVAAAFAGRTAAREVVYEDGEFGFCICLHVLRGGAAGGPHDHGPTWAIYGQADGITEMTDWRVVRPAAGEEPAQVEPVATYEMRPGDVHFYGPGDVHSPRRLDDSRLVRIEGRNLDGVARSRYRAAA